MEFDTLRDDDNGQLHEEAEELMTMRNFNWVCFVWLQKSLQKNLGQKPVQLIFKLPNHSPKLMAGMAKAPLKLQGINKSVWKQFSSIQISIGLSSFKIWI